MIVSKNKLAIFGLLSLFSLQYVRAQSMNVLTWHNGNNRYGNNDHESALTLANVNQKSFGKVGFYTTDGKVDAQPLYRRGVKIGGAIHSVLYVATEHDSVYAFDANSGTTLW